MKVIFAAAIWEVCDVLNSGKFGFKKLKTRPFEVWKSKKSLVVISGIGLVNAYAAFAWAAGEYRFSSALNVGMAGRTMNFKLPKGEEHAKMGFLYKISASSCIEPYNDHVFDLSKSGKTLVTSSRPVETRSDRIRAGKLAELVDMEGYAFARAAKIYGKKLAMYKLVSDFSPKCNIRANTLALRHKLAEADWLWI